MNYFPQTEQDLFLCQSEKGKTHLLFQIEKMIKILDSYLEKYESEKFLPIFDSSIVHPYIYSFLNPMFMKKMKLMEKADFESSRFVKLLQDLKSLKGTIDEKMKKINLKSPFIFESKELRFYPLIFKDTIEWYWIFPVYTHSANCQRDLEDMKKITNKNYYSFMMEVPNDGRREFFFASLDEITKFFDSTPVQFRHIFSCLSEAPIVGYLDLEYEKKMNQSINMEKQVEILIENFIELWKVYFPKEKVPSQDSFLIITASNDVKESIHLHGPFGYGFKNGYHFKAFLHELIDHLMKKDLCMIEKIENKKQVKKSIIDLEPYYIHSSLRMYQCSKCNDPFRVLKLSKINQLDVSKLSEHDLLKMTILNNVSENSKIIEFPDSKLVEKMYPITVQEFMKNQILSEDISYDDDEILGDYQVTNDFNSCTHFVFKKSPENFRIIKDLKEFSKKYFLNDYKKKYLIHQRIGSKSILCLEIKRTEILKGIGHKNYFYIQTFQKIISEMFKGEYDCLVFRIDNDFCRIFWPEVIIDSEKGKEIINAIAKKLTEGRRSNTNWYEMIVDVYSQGHISLLGSCVFGKGMDSKVEYRCSFNSKGEKLETKYLKEDLLEIISMSK